MKLDLDIEVNPIESKFTASLMDLMQREEMAVSQGKHDLVENTAKKVFAGLCSETTRHCALQSSSNQSRWKKVFEQQAEERRQMFQER